MDNMSPLATVLTATGIFFGIAILGFIIMCCRSWITNNEQENLKDDE